jgi:CheY-like chemotaxis protein
MNKLKSTKGGCRGTILVADDTAYVRIMLRKTLEPMGFDVIEAQNGAEAEQLLAQYENVSLLLLDIQMPGQDGLETLRNLREQGNKIPVIMLTASTQKENLMEAAKLGISAFMAKPFDRMKLRARVMATLEAGSASPPPVTPNKAHQVLIVDPLLQFRHLMKDILVGTPYQILLCPNADAAIQEFSRLTPNICLVNSLFTEHTDPHRLAEMRDNTESLRSMALVAYASDGELGCDQESLSPLKAGGVDECLPYPFGRDELVAVIEGVVKSRSEVDGVAKTS